MASSTSPQPRARRRSPHRTRRGASSAAPAPLDQRRYYDFRAGMAPAEIAARDNVTLGAVEKSLTRMRSYTGQFSQEAAEIATRQLYLNRLPDANHVFAEALAATKMETRVEVVQDPETRQYIEKTVLLEVPDHDTRLKATASLQKLLAGIMPKTPLVQVDARSQTNIGIGAGSPQSQGAISFESITRKIRTEQGLLTVGDVRDEANPEGIVETDTELEDDLEDDDEDDDDGDAEVGEGDDGNEDYAEDEDDDDGEADDDGADDE